MALPRPLQKLEDALHKPNQGEELERLARENAAIKIQRAWRAKKRSQYLEPGFLWQDLTTHAQLKVDRDAADKGNNAPRNRWRRAAFLVGRLEDGNEMLTRGGDMHSDAARKHLETQHWLELIDGKHRYGSNLKYYHQRWVQDDTEDNFFHWLDYGGGKDLSLKECPREELENERITYLSPQQRLNYLAQIDSDGKLRWARNGQLVDTTAGRWKDAGGGKGIVPLTHPEPTALQRRHSFDSTALSSSASGDEANQAMHYYTGGNISKNPIKRVLWNFTLRGIMDRLLRKTIRRNTWIYVSDKNFNIFIGIKSTGSFQHSSFLGGGLVTSAGLISVKDGLIHTLSPLSGHYRTSIQHFRQFISILEERGVNMEKVEISKAEAALWGIEHLGKFKKKKAAMVKAGKTHAAEAVQQAKSSTTRHPSDWKKEILGGRQKPQPADTSQGGSEHRTDRHIQS